MSPLDGITFHISIMLGDDTTSVWHDESTINLYLKWAKDGGTHGYTLKHVIDAAINHISDHPHIDFHLKGGNE